jgi:hypothetical protein
MLQCPWYLVDKWRTTLEPLWYFWRCQHGGVSLFDFEFDFVEHERSPFAASQETDKTEQSMGDIGSSLS